VRREQPDLELGLEYLAQGALLAAIWAAHKGGVPVGVTSAK
jgi:hypothetical protein